jgi:hypothetical protein
MGSGKSDLSLRDTVDILFGPGDPGTKHIFAMMYVVGGPLDAASRAYDAGKGGFGVVRDTVLDEQFQHPSYREFPLGLVRLGTDVSFALVKRAMDKGIEYAVDRVYK